MKIFKNLLTKQQQDYLENIVNNDQFPWFFYGNVIYDRNEISLKHTRGFILYISNPKELTQSSLKDLKLF